MEIFSAVFQTVGNFFKDLLLFGIKFGVVLAVGYLFYKVLKKRRIRTLENFALDEALEQGKITAKNKHLGNLYFAEPTNKSNMVSGGKILSYCKYKDEKGEFGKENEHYGVFLLQPSKTKNDQIYLIPKNLLPEEIKYDVVTIAWNFISQNGYNVINEIPEIKDSIDFKKLQEVDMGKLKKLSVDSVKEMQPIITNCINLDSRYKKGLKLKLLIKEPDMD